MKKVSILFILIFVCSAVFSQHIVYLKNGDRMKGIVIGGKNDTILFTLLNNNLRLGINDLTAVYFNDSIAPKDLYNQEKSVTKEVPKELTDSRIRGLISFFLPRVDTTHPDSGSRVWVVDSLSVPSFNINVVDTFLFGNYYREINQQYQLLNQKTPDDVIAQLALWKANDEAEFNRLCARANKELYILKTAQKVEKTTADRNGYFMIPVKSGTHYVFIISNNNQGGNSVEIEGKIYCKKVVISPDQEITVNHTFDVF